MAGPGETARPRSSFASRLLVLVVLVACLTAIGAVWYVCSPRPGTGQIRWRGLETGFDNVSPAPGGQERATEGEIHADDGK